MTLTALLFIASINTIVLSIAQPIFMYLRSVAIAHPKFFRAVAILFVATVATIHIVIASPFFWHAVKVCALELIRFAELWHFYKKEG